MIFSKNGYFRFLKRFAFVVTVLSILVFKLGSYNFSKPHRMRKTDQNRLGVYWLLNHAPDV